MKLEDAEALHDRVLLDPASTEADRRAAIAALCRRGWGYEPEEAERMVALLTTPERIASITAELRRQKAAR